MLDIYICHKYQGDKIPGFTKEIVYKLKEGKSKLFSMKYGPKFIS